MTVKNRLTIKKMKDKQVLISVIMPVYNGGHFLKNAIDSILSQSLTDFEFIIINDGSTDDSEEIILSYSDPRIVYVKNATNLRLIKSLNKGIDIARGKYIARMDADDIALPKRFERQVATFESDQKIDMVNVSIYFLDEKGDRYWMPKTKLAYNYEAIRYINVVDNMIAHPGVMIKADVLKRYKYLDSSNVEHAEDHELWARLLNNGVRCQTIKDRLLYYRLVSSSISHTNKIIQVERLKKTAIPYLSRFLSYDESAQMMNLSREHGSKMGYMEIKLLNTLLCSYIDNIVNNVDISKEGVNDLNRWKQNLILTKIVQGFRQKTVRDRLYLLIFLCKQLDWLLNYKWLEDLYLFLIKNSSYDYK